MTRIYRLTDRVSYKLGDIEVQISPLSYYDKNVLQQYAFKMSKGDMSDALASSKYALKAAVKSVKGLTDVNNNEYIVQFDESGKYLTDECVEELLNISESNKMISLCASLLAGVPTSNLPEGISLKEDKSPN